MCVGKGGRNVGRVLLSLVARLAAGARGTLGVVAAGPSPGDGTEVVSLVQGFQ